MAPSALWPAALAALLAAAGDGVPDASPALDRARALADGGDLEGAARALRARLAEAPGDLDVRLSLGALLALDGRPDEAAKAWSDGATGGETDFPLWIAVGNLRRRQAMEGPAPGAAPEAGERWRGERLREAAEAYRKALAARPADPDPVRSLAAVLEDLGEQGAAADLWRGLSDAHPGEVRYRVGLARALKQAGREEESLAAYGKALEADPRIPEAHEALAERLAAEGKAAEAEAHGAEAAFYRWMPPFAETRCGPEAFARYRVLAGADEAAFREEIERLLQDRSGVSTDFLAALSWQDAAGRDEARVFAALESRGEAAFPALRALLCEAPAPAARARAALALGGLDTPASRAVLEEGTARPDVAPFCHLALYRLTKDPGRLARVEAAAKRGRPPLPAYLFDYAETRLDTPDARAFLAKWRPKEPPPAPGGGAGPGN